MADYSHKIFIQIDGTSEGESFTDTISVPPQTIDKVTEIGADDFYLRARVPDVQNGLDATGPARGESDFSEDGYLIVVHDDSKDGSRVEIKPLNPARIETKSES